MNRTKNGLSNFAKALTLGSALALTPAASAEAAQLSKPLPAKAKTQPRANPTPAAQAAKEKLINAELAAFEEQQAREAWHKRVRGDVTAEMTAYAGKRAADAQAMAWKHPKANNPGFYKDFATQAEDNIGYVLLHTDDILKAQFPAHLLKMIEGQSLTVRQNVLLYSLLGFSEDRKRQVEDGSPVFIRMVGVQHYAKNRVKKAYRDAGNIAEVMAALVQFTGVGTLSREEFTNISRERNLEDPENCPVEIAFRTAYYTAMNGDMAIGKGALKDHQVALADKVVAELRDGTEYLTGEAGVKNGRIAKMVATGHGVMYLGNHAYLVPPERENTR